MKRKGIICVLAGLLALSLCACKKDGELVKVQLNEVAHSIFYAPMYVAIEEGYFKEEGIDLKLVNGLGADKTMTAVLSGEADIGFMGAEASVYVYNEGAEDYVVNFAQLTQRAGNFLVGRTKEDGFEITALRGKTVIGGRKGGMPQMVFEYILKKHGMNPETDLTILQNIDFGMTAQAFSAGTGDYTVEFEPAATALEEEGTGYVLASLGVESGYVPYTAFSAKKSYMEKNPKVIESIVKALQKGMDYVASHTPAEIAKVIAPQFAETSPATLETIVTRYYEQDTWKGDLIFTKDAFTLLLDILDSAGELSKRPVYEDLVNTEYARKAVK